MTAVVGGGWGRAASPVYVGRVGAFSALSGRCSPFKRHFGRGKGVCRVLTESSDDAPRVAPGFALLEPLTSKTVTLDECVGAEGVVVMFICNHCPFVVHLKQALVDIAAEYQPRGVNWVAICSNSVKTHPADGPDKMAEEAKQLEYPFPYLYDETQDVAKAYKAACTPEFYVYDAKMQLHYHGQFDDSRPRNDKPITGRDLRNALDALLRGQPLEGRQAPSIGCNIKWTPGNEPSYFGVQGS